MLLLLWGTLDASAQMNGTYTVDPSLPATSSNFKNLSSLFSQLSSNSRSDGGPLLGVGVSGPVTVNVNPLSSYTEQLVLSPIVGTSASNTIVVNGNGATVQFTAVSSVAPPTVRFNGADYVTLRGFTIRALGTSTAWAWGVHFINSSDFDVLDSCIIEIPNYNCATSGGASATGAAGIVFSGDNASPLVAGTAAKSCVISNCTIKGGGNSNGPHYGIICNPQPSKSTQSTLKLVNNIIQDFYSVGIYLTNTNGTLVKNNDISRPNLTVYTTSYGIRLINGNEADTVDGNEIHDCFIAAPVVDFEGISLNSTNSGQGVAVRNNLIFNNANKGIYKGISMFCAPNTKVYHNTVSVDDNNTSTFSDVYGIIHSGSCASNSEIKNNIISITRSGSAIKYGFYQSGMSMVVDYNVYYINAPNAYTGWSNGVAYSGLTSWQSATGSGSPYDRNSIATNPNFTDPSTGNFIPKSLDIDNAGTGLPVTRDINGVLRSNSTPDPGAYEFNIDVRVTQLILSGPANCQGHRDTVKVWVHNFSSFTISNIKVEYDVNSVQKVVETYTGAINSGDSAMYVFTTGITYSSIGVYSITARIKNKSTTSFYSVQVNPPPIGSFLIAGTPFKGFYNGGTNSNPDIVGGGDTVVYDLFPPSGYNSSRYGIDWIISRIEMATPNGTPVMSGDTFTIPGGPGFASLVFRPSPSEADSVFVIKITIYSILTGCEAPALPRTLFVAPKPTSGFTASNACSTVPVPFSNSSSVSSGNLRYKWYFGDGDSSDFTNPTKIYTKPGAYTAKLVAITNYGYTDTARQNILIYENPTVNFTYTNKCEGTAVPFVDLSTVINGTPNYTWSFGDASGSNQQNPVHLYPFPGLFTAKLTIIDSKGCVGSISKPVTYSTKPHADFLVPPGYCSRSSVPFTNNTDTTSAGFTGYTWDFGDGHVSTLQNPSNKYQGHGIFTVMLIARNYLGCADTSLKNITIIETPSVNFAASGLCNGSEVTFTNLTKEPAGDSVDYIWEFGDGFVSNNKNEVHKYTNINNYNVKLYASSHNGCSADTTITLGVGEKPLADFSLSPYICLGDTAWFYQKSNIGKSTLTYQWDFDDGLGGSGDTVSHKYNVEGLYNVKLIARTPQNCADSIVKSIPVTATPDSRFTATSSHTADGDILLTPLSPSGTGLYIWLYDDGGVSYQKAQHSHKYVNSGVYNICLKISESGCSSTHCESIIINTLGVGEQAKTVARVYPNPAENKVYIETNGSILKNVSLFTVSGVLISEQNYEADPSATLDLSSLKAGMYYVRVLTSNGLLTSKIEVLR